MKELKKEELENMSYKDITNILLESENKSLNTLELFKKIIELLELPSSTIDSKIADYYTSLTTDKRFVMIDGKWDLRTRHPSDKVIVKVDDEEDEEIEEEKDDDDNIEDDIDSDEYNDEDVIEDEFDEDDLKDLVVLSEEELEQEE